MSTIDCHTCRRPIDPRSAFCPGCGTKQEDWVPNPQATPKLSTGGRVRIAIGGITGILVVGTFLALVAVTSKPEVESVRIGDDAILELPGERGIYVALDKSSRDEMTAVLNRHDLKELGILMHRGKVAYLSNGTRAKVIDIAVSSRKVRIQNGEWEGKEGWVQTESIRPRRSGDQP